MTTGYPSWRLVICLFGAWLLVFLIISRGVKSSGKCSYFLALFPYVIMIALLIRAVTLEGASKGILFFLTPQWHELANPKVSKFSTKIIINFKSFGMFCLKHHITFERVYAVFSISLVYRFCAIFFKKSHKIIILYRFGAKLLNKHFFHCQSVLVPLLCSHPIIHLNLICTGKYRRKSTSKLNKLNSFSVKIPILYIMKLLSRMKILWKTERNLAFLIG